jgi:hypothetical protein
MIFERYARENDVFSEIYIDKEKIAVQKNDQATRNLLGIDITWVMA